MNKVISKILTIGIIFMLLVGNMLFSYAVEENIDEDWKQYTPSEYGDILTGEGDRAAKMAEVLQGAVLRSKEDAELYIKCVDAFQDSEIVRGGFFEVSKSITDKKTKAREIVNGEREPDGSGDLSSGKTEPWPNYENKISSASSDEDWEEIYNSFATPTPAPEGMTQYMAEKYIKLVGEILESGSFQIWADKNQADAPETLRQRLIEVASNNDIEDSKALEILEQNGADHGRNPIGTEPDTIYTSQPHNTGTGNSGESIDDVIKDADKFVGLGETQYKDNLDEFSNTIYNILLAIGVSVAVIVGAFIGVKLMASNIETKVEAKELLIPYVVGCVVVFGGFGIWKLVVTILQGM